ncbi:MAG: recombinase family protein [Bacteroidales bacterium]|nr:recombinase family protein [Bacteroidales bacterium]
MAEIDDNLIRKFAKGKKQTLKKGGRAVIYQRVSSKDQEDGFSPETQKECCYAWAERHKYEVVKCFEGEHESAKTDVNRKRFNQMLKFVKDKKNDDIEPLSKNEFLFVFDLKSVGYGKKKKDKPSILKICPVWLPNLDLNQGPSD